jgi:hypothetical protein
MPFLMRASLPVVLVLAAAGCAGRPAPVAADARTVDLAAFSRAPDPDPAPDQGSEAEMEPADGETSDPGTGRALGAGGPDAPADPFETRILRPGPPELPTGRRLEPGDRVIVDSLVGQVNGRPIFADAFFEPLADQLVAISRRATPQEFTMQAAQIISDELYLVVINALYLAEAEADLTQEQTQRIFAWLGQREEQVIAEFGGSEERAREEILALEGVTLEEYMSNLKDRALIQQLLSDRIAPRVIVSWRDIEREYERRRAEFNPPASMTLARIRLSTTTQSDAIADVEARLAAGEAFADVAAAHGQPNGGTWQTLEVGKAAEAFSSEVLLGQVATLKAVGDTTPAFPLGSSTWWLHLAELDQPPQRDLYDSRVQRMLSSTIRRARSFEEQDRYIATLMEKGIYDELDDMTQRLLRIAIRRYGP